MKKLSLTASSSVRGHAAAAFWLLGAALPAIALSPNALTPPLHFERNLGQADPSVRFLARAPGYTLLLRQQGAAVYALLPAESDSVEFVSMECIAARPSAEPIGEKTLSSLTRFYLDARPEAWHPAIPHYRRVRFPEIYPGIDLIFRGEHAQIEYAFRVRSGASPDQILLRFHGTRRAWVDDQGNLVLETPGGLLKHRRPIAYQLSNGQRRQVPVHYRLTGDTVGFETGHYDRSLPLLIDPVLEFSSYLGGAGFDAGYGIASDSSGNIYVIGETASSDFPLPPGASKVPRANRDVFVTKLNATGSAVLYTTILASSGNDAGRAIAVDAAGNAHVAGVAGSGNFPVTSGAFRTAFGGLEDAFVARLDTSGRLAYSTFLGASGSDTATAIAVDSAGNAYVTGYTGSPDFPTTPGSPQTAYRGGFYDAFLAKLNPAGSALVYSTLLGGAAADLAWAIALGPLGNACIAGYTASSDLPVRNPLQAAYGGSGDALVACLNASGTAWNYVTYLGGDERRPSLWSSRRHRRQRLRCGNHLFA